MFSQKKFIQETVIANTPEEFDRKLNAIYERAAEQTVNKEPEIHYFDNLGLCASVRYWIYKDIPQSLEDEYALLGIRHECRDCGHFCPPTDRRSKHGLCELNGSRKHREMAACELHYEELERRERFVIRESFGRDGETRHQVRAAGESAGR